MPFAVAGPNLLVAGGRTTGVAGWGPLPGDRTFDPARLRSADGYDADVAAARGGGPWSWGTPRPSAST